MMLAASEPGRHRPDRDQRRADVLLGRRLAAKAKATTRCATPAACSAAPGSPRSPPTSATACSTAPIWCENFENLNPANTFWDKYYHLFANVDTEPPRFLEFERWWGGFYLMNREEIEWITRNLFVGNKLWSGDAQATGGKAFDLREIKSPIILFASMGDNITPPQQAFNWVADVYGSTEEIKARGQVIVGLLHQDIGHLGIFVSGKVAKKEHAQIVSVMKSIEALPPGLYGMEIIERKGANGKRRVRRRVRRAPARGGRRAPQPLQARRREAVRGGRGDLRVQPARLRAVRAAAGAGDRRTSDGAKLARDFHPLRFQRWAISDLNPVARRGSARRGERSRRSARRSAPTSPRARSRSDGSELDQRVARLLPRRARRDERGAVLPDLRQPVLAVPGGQARGGRSASARGRSTRASCRSSRRRWRRSRRAAMPRRSRVSRACSRARASRCRCRGWQLRQELIGGLPRSAARDAAAIDGAASAASRRSSSATSRSRRSRTLPKLLARPRRPREARARWSDGSWPTSACSVRSRRPSSWRCSSTSAKRWRSIRGVAPRGGATQVQKQRRRLARPNQGK